MTEHLNEKCRCHWTKPRERPPRGVPARRKVEDAASGGHWQCLWPPGRAQRGWGTPGPSPLSVQGWGQGWKERVCTDHLRRAALVLGLGSRSSNAIGPAHLLVTGQHAPPADHLLVQTHLSHVAAELQGSLGWPLDGAAWPLDGAAWPLDGAAESMVWWKAACGQPPASWG